jgi:hypothetical protein
MEDKILCKHCKQEIEKSATVCHHCQRPQGRFWSGMNRAAQLTALAMVVLVIIQVIIANRQVSIAQKQVEEAKAKRIEAKKVLDEVNKVKAKADSALSEVYKVSDEAHKVLDQANTKVNQISGKVDMIDENLNLATKRLEATENKFIARQAALSEDVTALKGELSKEIDKLKALSELIYLADEAKATGLAAPYDELKKRKSIAEDEQTRNQILSQIMSIKGFYGSMTRVKGRYLQRDGVRVNPDEIQTRELLTALEQKESWITRALVVMELGDRKEIGVPEALIKCASEDKFLDVRKLCIDAFEKVIDNKFKNPDVLDPDGIKHYWSQNKDEIEKGWAEGTTEN